MNKRKVTFHESVKKEDGNSIKRIKKIKLNNRFNFNSINQQLNKIEYLDNLIINIQDDNILLSSVTNDNWIALKNYSVIDIEFRNKIISELFSRNIKY